MIVTKTPLRVSFFGGGSDLPAYYNQGYPGLCLSAAIKSYIYITLHECQADHIKAIYSELELVKTIDQLKHDRIRAVFNKYDILSNIEMCSFSDVGTKGTGLGSSSTFTVGLIKACNELIGYSSMTPVQIAELACSIEIEDCGQKIGKQDQYAAAFGGFNAYRFTKDGVSVEQILLTSHDLEELEYNLFLVNTGLSRDATKILEQQVHHLETDLNRIQYMNEMVNIAEVALRVLKEKNFDRFGRMLNTTWELKKKMSSAISTPLIDDLYIKGIQAGATGGKLLGAGGGGYMLFYVPEKNHVRFYNEFRCMEQIRFAFSPTGSTVELSI